MIARLCEVRINRKQGRIEKAVLRAIRKYEREGKARYVTGRELATLASQYLWEELEQNYLQKIAHYSDQGLYEVAHTLMQTLNKLRKGDPDTWAEHPRWQATTQYAVILRKTYDRVHGIEEDRRCRC